METRKKKYSLAEVLVIDICFKDIITASGVIRDEEAADDELPDMEPDD